MLLLVCLGYACYYVYELVRWMPYHNQIDYGEGYMQYVNIMFANGTWSWDLSTPPFVPLMYGIVEPLVVAPLINVFGNDLWVTRVVMCLSTAIISVMVYLIIHRMTGYKLWAIIGALIPFTQPVIRDWSFMARVDMLAVMFDIVGLYLFIRLKDSRHVYWSIIPFTLAVFTKATCVAALAAVLLYLLIKNRRLLLKYAVCFGVLFGGCFAVVQYISGGQYLTHVVTASRTTSVFWNLAALETNWVGVLTPLAAILALAILYVKKCRRAREMSVFALFFVVAFAVDFVSALRVGSFVNYYIEFILATCICAVLILPRFIEMAKSQYKKGVSAVAPYALVLAVLFVLLAVISPKHAFPFPNGQYDEDVAAVTEIIGDTDRPIVTENAGVVVNAGKDLYIELFIMTNWAELGIWDDSSYVAKFEEQEFDYVIMRMPISHRPDGDGHFSGEVMDAIRNNYTLIYSEVENFYWYGISLYRANNRSG